MKISVVIPVYNVEDYLSKCIESVIRQTYQDFEIILIDDGSLDCSGVICDQYVLNYPRKIKVFHETNGGPFRARLIGMRESTGDFLIFLDSDDCLRSDALEKIADCFEREQSDMIMFDAGECGEFSTIAVKHYLKPYSVFEGIFKNEIYRCVIEGAIPNSVCLKAFRLRCAKIPKSFFECNLKHGEDLLLSAHLMTHCQKIVYINEELYYYRNRYGSAIHSFNVQRKESIKTVHTELEKYIDQWGMPELKPLHNARKVRGWMDQLKLLQKNKKHMKTKEFRKEMTDMATDAYFIDAYHNMDASKLSSADRLLAKYLYNRRYNLISLIYLGKRVLARVKVK